MPWMHNTLFFILSSSLLFSVVVAQVVPACFVECDVKIIAQTGCTDADIVCRCEPNNLIIAKNCIQQSCSLQDQIAAAQNAILDCPNATAILFSSSSSSNPFATAPAGGPPASTADTAKFTSVVPANSAVTVTVTSPPATTNDANSNAPQLQPQQSGKANSKLGHTIPTVISLCFTAWLVMISV